MGNTSDDTGAFNKIIYGTLARNSLAKFTRLIFHRAIVVILHLSILLTRKLKY